MGGMVICAKKLFVYLQIRSPFGPLGLSSLTSCSRFFKSFRMCASVLEFSISRMGFQAYLLLGPKALLKLFDGNLKDLTFSNRENSNCQSPCAILYLCQINLEKGYAITPQLLCFATLVAGRPCRVLVCLWGEPAK